VRVEHDRADGPRAAEPVRNVSAMAGTGALDDAGATPDAFRVMTWNVEWFGDPSHGPRDESRQEAGVAELVGRWRPALLALQEVSDDAALARVAARLGGFDVVAASTPGPQRLALLYLRARFEVLAAEELAGVEDAGRPPLRVTVRDHVQEANLDVIVLHAKAGREASDWHRRHGLARALGAMLTRESTDAQRIVLGDFNDRLDGSIAPGFATPFGPLLDAGHVAPTASLDAASGGASTPWGATVDHVVVSTALAYALQPGSAEIVRDDALHYAPEFLTQVSDHFPFPVSVQVAP
jgi:hypothetical protein